PAVALILGGGLLGLSSGPGGRLFPKGLFAFAALGNAAIMTGRIALFSGCARLADGNKRLSFDGPCAPGDILQALGVLVWPRAGLPLIALALALFCWSAWVLLRAEGAPKPLEYGKT